MRAGSTRDLVRPGCALVPQIRSTSWMSDVLPCTSCLTMKPEMKVDLSSLLIRLPSDSTFSSGEIHSRLIFRAEDQRRHLVQIGEIGCIRWIHSMNRVLTLDISLWVYFLPCESL